MARLQGEAEAAEAAHRRGAQAHARARSLVAAIPQELGLDAPAGLDSAAALAAWQEWVAVPDVPGPAGLAALADHVLARWGPLAEAVRTLTTQARADLAEREDRWAPLAGAVSAWCDAAGRAQVRAGPVPAIKAAQAWLKGATDDIRNDRLAPVAQQARDIWAQLRQESNVELDVLRLAGSATQRHLDLDVTVDDAPGAALSVMSQGELNALALSIFLPRSTLGASPFRFLVIDDPVQAMDPAKVDGLARVLEMVARRRGSSCSPTTTGCRGRYGAWASPPPCWRSPGARARWWRSVEHWTR